MSHLTKHDAIVIIFDVGKSVSEVNRENEDKTFFQLSRECLSWIIQRKLISRSSDVMSIVLIGSGENNSKWAVSGYKNIFCKFDFQQASWEMLSFVESEITPTEYDSDWFGALVISIEMLKIYEEFNNVETKKIVFFTDFIYPASDDLDLITKNLKTLNIIVTIIGSVNFSCMLNNEEEEEQSKSKKPRINESIQNRLGSERIVYTICKKIPEQIVLCNFRAALKQLCSYTRKTCRKTPWNCILDIGDVKIRISMFKKTDPKSSKKFNTNYVKWATDESEKRELVPSTSQLDTAKTISVIRGKAMHYKHETGAAEEFVNKKVLAEDTIEGFRYGVNIIPLTDEDKSAMYYKPGPKSFSILGFTNISCVPLYLLSGDCSYIVLPREGDENAEIAFSSIVQALKQMECLAVVRKVYSSDRGLSLGILYPLIEEIEMDGQSFHKDCLIFIELAFQEDIKFISLPPLENISSKITQKQLDIVDELIDKMDLMKADTGLLGEPCEAFDLENVHDIDEQFFDHCLIQKGLYPERPLPTGLPNYIENFIKSPKQIEENCKECVSKLKEEFNITASEFQKKKSELLNVPLSSSINKFSEVSQHSMETLASQELDQFKQYVFKLFNQNLPKEKDFDELVHSLRQIDSLGAAESFVEAIESVRRRYLDKNPDRFNSWMSRFKGYVSKKKTLANDIWNIILKHNLTLISKKENKYSEVSESQAQEFLLDPTTESLLSSTSSQMSDLKSQTEKRKDFEEELNAVGTLFH